jgi:hypothetical protein
MRNTVILSITGVLLCTFLFCALNFKVSNSKSVYTENLEAIQAAKINWAMTNGKTAEDTPTWDDLREFLRQGLHSGKWKDGIPVCPNGGTYTINRVGELPTCSVDGRHHFFTSIRSHFQ